MGNLNMSIIISTDEDRRNLCGNEFMQSLHKILLELEYSLSIRFYQI